MGHYRPASESPFKWRFAGVPMVTQNLMLAWKLCDFSGDPDEYCNEIYIFVIFQGAPDPLTHHVRNMYESFYVFFVELWFKLYFFVKIHTYNKIYSILQTLK